MRFALLALAALLASPAVPCAALPAAPPAAALTAVADALATEVGAPAEGRTALLLAVEARSAALRAPLETALAAALAQRGYSVTPHRGGAEPEGAARAAGQDWLLRVRGGLVPGRRELAAVGELIPAWASFFLQRRPGARALPPRLVQARAAADPETLLLGREARPTGAPFATLRPLARVEGRVLAVAIGDAGAGGAPVLVVAGADFVQAFTAAGEPLAARAAEAPPPRVRDPAAALAVGDFGAGRIALRRAGAGRGEVLALRGGRLEPAGELDAVPLCAGDAGPLFGTFEPGTGALRDPRGAGGGAPRSGRRLQAVACAPRGGPIAFAALGADLRLALLGPQLRPVALPARAAAALATGAGLALADLDDDGTAELVASSADPAAPERIRIVAPLSEAPLLLESAPVEGAILAGAAGDLTGDGADDAVLAAIVEEAGAAWTRLLLVTSDPREGP